MATFDRSLTITINDEIYEKGEALKLWFPNDYESVAHVFRAGLLTLFNKRKKEKKEGVDCKNG